MAAETSDAIRRQVETLFSAGAVGLLTDGQLLERFLGRSEQAEPAFEALVQRHGPMVFRVCQSVLGDWHDAQDAFQATFLILARQAHAVRKADSVGSWLFGVASRVSARARRMAALRRLKEQRSAAMSVQRVEGSESASPMPELYEELNRLPERYRGPIVLCHLEGQSYEQAARQLRVPLGTLQSRLARGRDRLRARLLRRGLAPAVVGIAMTSVTTPSQAAVLPPGLVAATSRAATQLLAGGTVAGLVSSAVNGLVRDVQRTAVMGRLITMVLVMLAIGLAATGAGALAFQKEEQPKPVASAPSRPAEMVYLRVVDGQAQGVPNIRVRVHYFGEPERSVETDADGRAAVPAEFVGVNAAFIATDDQSVSWASYQPRRPDHPQGTQDDPLVLKMVPLTRKVTGTVVDQDGKPIPGVRIQVTSLFNQMKDGTWHQSVWFGNLRWNRGAWPGDQAISDTSGRYSITLPASTRAYLGASHARYVGPSIVCAEDAAQLGPATLEPAGSIIGTITDATTGEPVAGARLGAQLIEFRERILNGAYGEAITDAQGHYEIVGLEPGVYNVLFSLRRGQPHETAVAAEAVRVVAGKDEVANLKRIEGRRVQGTVTDPNTGKPMPDLPIGYYGPARPRSGAAIMSNNTDKNGHFELFVPPGSAYIYIAKMDYSPQSSHQTIDVPPDRDPEPIEFRPFPRGGADGAFGGVMKKQAAPIPAPAPAPAPVVVPVEEQAIRTVRGRVVDRDGKPVVAAKVQYNKGRFVQATTDRDGVFVLQGMPLTKLGIFVSKDGYAGSSEQIDADRDEVEFVLRGAPAPPTRPVAKPAGPRDPNVVFIDLDPYGTDTITEGPGGERNNLASLPEGEQTLAGIRFHVGKRMIHLFGLNAQELPPRITGIKVNTAFKTLHVLHATQQATENGTEIGAYILHYADGSRDRIPLVYGENICNWWEFREPEQPSRAIVAWKGTNDIGEREKRPVRLFAMTWENRFPAKVVETIEFESASTLCDPFVVAITAIKK